jgi:Bacterial Ig-like domain
VRAELWGVVAFRGRIGALAALAVLGLFAPAAAVADPTPDQAVLNLNTWRSEVGESLVSTTTVSAWNTACAHHNTYERLNGNSLTHTEVSGHSGYTTDGAAAGLNSVIADSFSFPDATPVASLLPGPTWDGAVFHRAALLDPRLAQIGFDSQTADESGQWWSFDCLYVQGGDATNGQALDNTRTTPGLTLYPSPGNGAYHVPTSFPGNEFPDPTAETGVPGGAQLGWLLSVEINGPWVQTNFGYGAAAHGVTATLAPDGTTNTVPVVISQCGPSGCGGTGGTSDGSYFRGGFGIFPTEPLTANTVYRVVITGGTITDFATHMNYPIPAGYHWCFSTGAAYTPSSDCAPSTTAAEEPANPNASTAPTGGNGAGGNPGGGGGGSPGGGNPGGGGSPGGGNPGGGGRPGGGSSSHRTTLTDTVEDHSISASLSLPNTCLAKSKTVSVATSTARIAGSHAHAVHFFHALVFIDRGIKHVRHHTVRRHGRTVRITTVSYSANRTIGALPSTITLKLATLSSGSHTLRIVFTFHRTVRKNGRSHTVASTRTLSTKFRVC